MPTMMQDDSSTGNARIDAELKKAKGNGQSAHDEGDGSAAKAVAAAKEKAGELSDWTRGVISASPYTSVIAVFALGLFFGFLGGK